MKTKVKFKAISHQGEVVYFTHEFEHPDFEVKPPSEFLGVKLPETTIESQVIDWLDSQDKKSLMYDKDVYGIIDYWIPTKVKKQTLVDCLKSLNLSEQIYIDMLAVYKEIKPTLKGMKVEKKVSVLLSHLGVGYSASGVAYDNITKMLRDENFSLTGKAKQLISEPTKANN